MSRTADRERFLLETVDAIYAAGFGETGWDGVNRSLRDATGSSVVGIHLDDPIHGAALGVSFVGIDPEAVELYESHYVGKNPWLLRAQPVFRTGIIVRSERFVSQESVRRTEYYNDFARPNGMARAMGVILYHEPDLIAFYSLMRPPGAGPFSAEEVETVRLLAPHLQRAAAASRIFRRLRGRRWLAGRALDALGGGAAVMDRRGRTVFVNRRMEEIAREDDGVLLGPEGLRFAEGRAQRNLEAILERRGVEATGGAFRAPRPSLKVDYEVVASPLPKVECPPSVLSPLEGRGGWLVLVTDPERKPVPPREILERLYGLTEAEAEVADLLLAGKGLREIGAIRATTLNTVKTQARAVYRKVDVSSRSELVRRLSGLEGGEPRS